MILERTTGPPCPACGCCDSELVRKSARFGRSIDVLRCTACGRVFRVQPDDDEDDDDQGEPVVYQLTRCPACGSQRTKVTSTRRPVRHHKCEDCGERFKSYEEGR